MSDLVNTEDLTNEQLLEYFNEHVNYEINMLLTTTNAIKNEPVAQPEIQNMLVESFVIHLRNLIDFLYNDSPQKTDVCARHFFISEEVWEKIRPIQSEALIKAKRRANKEVGHLTTERQFGVPESKKWTVESLSREVMLGVDVFCKNADKLRG